MSGIYRPLVHLTMHFITMQARQHTIFHILSYQRISITVCGMNTIPFISHIPRGAARCDLS